jgi:hypothetical protein
MREILGGLMFLVVAGMALYWGRDLSLGQLRLPGPGAMPRFAAAAIAVLALTLVVRGIRNSRVAQPSPGDQAGTASGGQLRIAAAAALIGAFALTLSWAGFLVSTTVLASALFVLGAPRAAIWSSLAFGVCVAGSSYVLFVRLLDIRMPMGSLWGH